MLNHDRVMQMVKKKIINNTKSNWYSLKFNFYWFRCWCYPRFEVFFDNEVEYLKLYAIKYIIGHKCMYPWKYQFNSSPRNVLLSQFFVRLSCVHLCSPLRLRLPFTLRFPFVQRSLIVQSVLIHFHSELPNKGIGLCESQKKGTTTRALRLKETYFRHKTLF